MDAPRWVSPGWNSQAAMIFGRSDDSTGNAAHTDCGVKRAQLGGRSRFIPGLLNGGRIVGADAWRSCTLPMSGPTAGVLCDDAVRGIRAVAASRDCNVQLPRTATNRLSAA